MSKNGSTKSLESRRAAWEREVRALVEQDSQVHKRLGELGREFRLLEMQEKATSEKQWCVQSRRDEESQWTMVGRYRGLAPIPWTPALCC